jgi:hypothetical protein
MSADDSIHGDRDLSPSAEEVETSLRRLPAVNVPRDLEARLISAIPAASMTTRRKRRWQSVRRLATFGIAATVAAIAVWLIGHERRDPQSVAVSPLEVSVVATTVQFKETDPCNILPPLADWR